MCDNPGLLLTSMNVESYNKRGAIRLKYGQLLWNLLLVERLSAYVWQNRSVYDISVKIGMSSLHGSLDKKIVRATWNFKMAAIFSRLPTP